jgi:hypothetical protein
MKCSTQQVPQMCIVGLVSLWRWLGHEASDFTSGLTCWWINPLPQFEAG